MTGVYTRPTILLLYEDIGIVCFRKGAQWMLAKRVKCYIKWTNDFDNQKEFPFICKNYLLAKVADKVLHYRVA
jgi:hypothetical protein